MARHKEIDWQEIAVKVVSLIQENQSPKEIEQFLGMRWANIARGLHRSGFGMEKCKEWAFQGMPSWKKRDAFGHAAKVSKMIANGFLKQNRWGFIVEKNFYKRDEVYAILGFRDPKIQQLVRDGKLKKIGRGEYDKKSVDAYRAEMNERLAITPAKFLQRGNLT